MAGEPRRNRAGRAIWFAPSRDGGGVYRPVNWKGGMAMLLALAWLLVCAAIGMAGFLHSLDGRWFVAMFAGGGAGLALFAATVIRHS